MRRAVPESDLDFRAYLPAFAAQRDHVAFGGKRGLVIFKGLLCGGLVFAAHRLADVDFDFVLVPRADDNIAMVQICNGFEAGTLWERLLQISLERVTGATHVEIHTRPISFGGDARYAANDHKEY